MNPIRWWQKRQRDRLMAPFYAYQEKMNARLASQGVSPADRQRILNEWWRTIRESFSEPR